MGKIDMYFMLTTLLVHVSGMLDEPWVQSTQLLRKVRFTDTKSIDQVLMSVGLSNSCAPQALEDASLDLHSIFLVVHDLLSHWAHFVSYISETDQRQEFQVVQGQVSLFILLVPICLGCLSYALMLLQDQIFKMQANWRRVFRMQTRIVKAD